MAKDKNAPPATRKPDVTAAVWPTPVQPEPPAPRGQNNLSTKNPPSTPAATRLVTKVSRRSMKSRIGSPKTRSSAATKKNLAPRVTTLAAMNTGKLKLAAPEAMVTSL